MSRPRQTTGATGPGAEPTSVAAPPVPLVTVGLGASAGGLEALERLFDAMPADTGLVFVVVQHLDRHHPSMLPELLGRHTSLPVHQIEDGTRPLPNHVYVIPPDAELLLERGRLRVRRPAETRLHQPVDTFLRSLAEEHGETAVGIVLSGNGTDGTAGVRAIKEQGGMTLAQAPESARCDGMPQSAIASGLVDFVLPVAQMPARLLEHQRTIADLQRAGAKELEGAIIASLGPIGEILHRRTGHDFRCYKQGTLVRRIRRRLQLKHLATAADYVLCLEEDAGEPELLLKDLLIGVTQFFRDPETFQALAEQVIPLLFEGKEPGVPVRVWVPGCASGEEAYSLAILLREQMERRGGTRPLQIFATDIDPELTQRARQGRYPEEIRAHVSAARLDRFFVHQGGVYQVTEELRETCIFSAHSIIKDPPFSSLDLISCRNVLIYLDVALQKKLAPLFHYALKPHGFLFLGPSEGLASYPELFVTLDKKHRIFRRSETVGRPRLEFPLVGLAAARTAPPPGAPAATGRCAEPPLVNPAFERMLLDEYVPACVVVNERGDILFTAGLTGLYLRNPMGAATLNLLDLAPGALGVELRTALYKVAKHGRKVVRDQVPVEVEGRPRLLRVTLRPMPGVPPESGLYVVILQEQGVAPVAPEDGAVAAEEPLVDQLATELRTTRADLQSAVEELASANEDLKSSNEELISTNEELQSANEELQTSKEELQSVNEELETVNTELHEKVVALGAANNDLQNLYASSEIATVFLDRALRIAKYTPAAAALLHLLEGDVGRPIADLAPPSAGQDLHADADQVLRRASPLERQVQTAEGRWLVVRVLPYRTAENTIGGVGITFVDVTELKQAAAALREADRHKNEFLAMLSHELRNPLAPIRNSLFILERAAPGGEQEQRARAVIDRQIGHLTRLVDDLLDVTRISRGKVQLQRERLDLVDLVRRASEDHKAAFAAGGVTLESRLPDESVWVRGDGTRLAQVVGNLLQNAAKFTGHGGTTVVSVARGADDTASVSVRDSGVGIAAEMLPKLFEPFAQADMTLDRARGGLGLGLALVKGIVALHGGTVAVRSDGPGAGAEFTVRLPLDRSVASVARAPRATPAPARPLRLLVIEDNVDAGDSLREVLLFGGHEVEVARDGCEGLEKARQFRPAVVLCDIGLPFMDGYAVARAFRADPELEAVFLVALTGYASPDDVARAREAGFDAHLAKPPSPEALNRTLADVTTGLPPRGGSRGDAA